MEEQNDNELKQFSSDEDYVDWKRVKKALLVYFGIVLAISAILIFFSWMHHKLHRYVPDWFEGFKNAARLLSMVPVRLFHLRFNELTMFFGVIASLLYFALPWFLYMIFRRDRKLYVFLTFAFYFIYAVLFAEFLIQSME
jgi:hypothetical protein